MFRDGFLTDNKGRRKYKVPVIKEKNMMFSELVSLLDIVSLTGDKSYLQHIDDSFALMLLFGVYRRVDLPKGIVSSDVMLEEYRCSQVWGMIHDPQTDWKPVLMSLKPGEQFILQEIVEGRIPAQVSARDIIREFSKIRAFDVEDAYRAWLLQPDSEAMSYAILSTYTKKSRKGNPGFQRITPAAGVPVHLMYPSGRLDQIRYPCVAMEVPVGERAQLHKDGEWVRVFDSRHNLIYEGVDSRYSAVPHDGVFDGFWDDGSFSGWDILQLNDVWLYNDELYSRLKFLWRLAYFTVSWGYVFNADELRAFDERVDGPVVVKNLNSQYNPRLDGAWIEFTNGKTVQLKVSRAHRGSATTWTLMTEDGEHLFQFGGQNVGLSNKDRIVEVNRQGKILRHRPDLGFAHSWSEVRSIFEIETAADLVPEGSEDWVKSSLWRKLSQEQGF